MRSKRRTKEARTKPIWCRVRVRDDGERAWIRFYIGAATDTSHRLVIFFGLGMFHQCSINLLVDKAVQHLRDSLPPFGVSGRTTVKESYASEGHPTIHAGHGLVKGR